jgi:hypothetical protein
MKKTQICIADIDKSSFCRFAEENAEEEEADDDDDDEGDEDGQEEVTVPGEEPFATPDVTSRPKV